MYQIKSLFTNYVLMSAVFSWLAAQILKVIFGVFKDQKMNIFQILGATGGMPSSHSATVLALLTSCIIRHGFGSTEFAIAAVLAIIVLVDAVGVRRETGEQAVILNRMMKGFFNGEFDDFEKGLKELVGHTPLQVLVGSILGIAIAIGCSFIPFLQVTPPTV